MNTLLIAALVLVTNVHDGDTVTINGKQKVRLIGIDAPELKQPYGTKSRDLLKIITLNHEVGLETKGKDFYGRTLGELYMGPNEHTSINVVMIREGAAWVYNLPKKSPIREYENEARREKLGLWALPTPEAPWEYRKRMKNAAKTRKSTKTNSKNRFSSGRNYGLSRLAR